MIIVKKKKKRSKIIFHYFFIIFYDRTINTTIVNQSKQSRKHPLDRDMELGV